MIRRSALIGLAFGAGGVHLAVVGVLLMLHQRWIIINTVSLGQAALLMLAGGAGWMTRNWLGAVIAGAMSAVPLAALTVVIATVPLQTIFIALSNDLYNMLTLELDLPLGIAILVAGGAVAGLVGAALRASPPVVRRAIFPAAITVIMAGVFQELIQLILQQYEGPIGEVRDFLYTWEGLAPQGAITIFIVVALFSEILGSILRRRAARIAVRDHRKERLVWAGLALLALVLLPAIAGSYVGQVLMLVGLYILMGMGLNLEVGLAGLLDLGFVAFFAVGAYTTALLTADSPHSLAAIAGFPHLNYWMAMPIAVMISVVVGVLFGIPVLGVRGDYLAVATMGLGEIVRVIVQSDAASPLLAGAEGILQIPKPRIFGFELSEPVELFYLTLLCAGIAAYFAWRLENSRLGRAWMAVRDDEDVAQALGINLVKVKLLAYGLGAAFAGLSGSIFAVMLTSVYPSSFQLLISINVLALIIVGGMGSLPGVAVGALALIGLPELLREFGEFRFLFYGAALIIMMRVKPEGLCPSATRRRELRAAAGEDMVEDPVDQEPAE